MNDRLHHPPLEILLLMKKDTGKLSDEELIEGGIRKDPACLGELYSRYFKKVHQQCMAFVKDRQTAFDLSQDILLKAFSRLPSFRKNSSFSSWLWAIGNNHCKDYSRTIKRQAQVSLHEEKNLGIAESTEEHEQLNLTEEILPLLEHLPATDRDLLILKYSKGTSVQELQHIFQLSESAVKMRLSRAKEKLTSLLHQKHPSLYYKIKSLPK